MNKLNQITRAFRTLDAAANTPEFDELATRVTGMTDASESAITVMTTLKTKLDAAIAALPNPQALKDLSASLGAETQKLADAIVANTPAEPAP